MARQQTRQRGDLSTPTCQQISEDETEAVDTVQFEAHRTTLGNLAAAQATRMFLSQHTAVALSKQTFEAAMQDDASFCWLFSTDVPQLYLDAAVNVMNVLLQDSSIRSSLLDHGKLVSIVLSLCSTIVVYLGQASSLQSQGKVEGARQKVQLQITAAGLPATLSRFTAAAWQAVQQLDASRNHQQQQQQQHPGCKPASMNEHSTKQQQQQQHEFVLRCGETLTMIVGLLRLWQELFNHADDCPSLRVAVIDTLPALIGLTTAAAPLVHRAKHVAGSSSSKWAAVYDEGVAGVADRGIAVASFLAVDIHRRQAEGVGDAEQQQTVYHQLQPGQQQHIYLTEKLPELLLQLLACLACKLHTACGGSSQPLQDRHAAAADADASQQGQQQQQPFAGCAVPKSHQVLLQSVGLGWHDRDDDDCSISLLMLHVAVALEALFIVLRARYHRASFISNSNESRSSSKTQQDAGQQHQQVPPGDISSVLASHLLVPAVKVLIEAVLLMPHKTLSVHAYCLKLSLLLVHTASKPAAAAAAEGTTAPMLGQQVPAPPVSPWPKLPAAVAAGLLRPVVAQLSQAVTYCLLQTDQQQQQDCNMAVDRLSLLHYYGSLPITVCQSVEPKHIAAVLKSQSPPDLLITLAAIEAVIRAQACHLAPEHCRQQQQQQIWQECPSGVCNTAESEVIPSIVQYPLECAPRLLLPFVSGVVAALRCLICGLYKEHALIRLVEGDSVSGKLSARLYTLLTTAFKVSKCAAISAEVQDTGAAPATAAAACNELHLQTIHDSCKIVEVASCWFGTAQRITNNDNSRRVRAWSIVLLGRATRAFACSLSVLAAINLVLTRDTESAPSSASLSAAANDLQGLGASESIIPFGAILLCLADVYEVAKHELDDLAAQAETACSTNSSAGRPTLTGHQIHSMESCCAQLPSLLRQAMQVGALIRSTMQLAVIEVGANSSASDLAIMSHKDLYDTITQHARSIRPSKGLLANLQHSSTLLYDLGDAVVSCIPLQICCNSPLCTNLRKLSEWQLVCGKACVCAGCGVARYCSTSCQEKHWQLHKPVCRGL